jgi:hypothetical protein
LEDLPLTASSLAFDPPSSVASAPTTATSSSPDIVQVQSTFLNIVLPMVQSHARVSFRHLKCPHKRADAVQEMIALSWQWHVRLAEQGRDAAEYPSALATFAARAVRSGRKLAGMDRINDALSPLAQRTRGFCVSSLPDGSSLKGNPLDVALHDNRRSPVPDQVAFRNDFPRWLDTLSNRDRRLAEDLMVGDSTQEVASRFGLSQSRVSQLRRDFQINWARYCGDVPPLNSLA